MDAALQLARDAADAFRLGTARGPVTPVPGGLLNRTWRLETDTGTFAVKELTHTHRRALADYTRALEVEQAALAAGLDLPRPIPDPVHGGPTVRLGPDRVVLVHEWVGGRTPSPDETLPIGTIGAVGHLLGRLHGLDLDPNGWARLPSWDACPDTTAWSRLAVAARRRRRPWAGALSDAVGTFGAITDRVRSERDDVGPLVVSHRDADRKNLLLSGSRPPTLIDWEACGPTYLGHELGKAALDLAAAGVARLDRQATAALFAGYAAGSRFGDGPRPPAVAPAWLSEWYAAASVFLASNVRLTTKTAEPDRLGERVVAILLPRLLEAAAVWDDCTADLRAAARAAQAP